MKNTTLAKEVCNRSVTYLVDRNSGENYCTNTPCFYQNPTLSIFLQKQTKKNHRAILIFRSFATFFGLTILNQVPNKSFYLLNWCQSWTEMQESTTEFLAS